MDPIQEKLGNSEENWPERLMRLFMRIAPLRLNHLYIPSYHQN